MKRRTRRVLTGILCFVLCFSINVSPTVTLATAIVESGIVDDLGNIKNNLLRYIKNSITEARAETTSSESGKTITDVYNTLWVIEGEVDSLEGDMDNVNSELDNIHGDLDEVETELGDINDNLEEIETELGDVNNNLEDIGDNVEKIELTLQDIKTAVEKNGKEEIIKAIEEQTGALQDHMDACLEVEANIIKGVTGYSEDHPLNVDIQTLISQLGYDPSIGVGGGSVAKDLANITEKLDEIKATIEAGQHKYRVAHLYSLNNTYAECLWKPYSKDVPYVTDFATVSGKFANVYSGYWDSSVQTIKNPGNMKTNRALEILGYDAIVRHEGVVLQNNLSVNSTSSGQSGNSITYSAGGAVSTSVATYVKELIPENNITYLDAVTLLYKALGQYEYTYQSFMAEDKSITPETSPAVQGLSGVTEFDGYDFYMFLSRSNTISGTGEKQTMANTYWVKAVNDGFVNQNKKDEVIIASDFFILATKMMQAFGEPVINDDEIKALLQVYGSDYPIQLGVEIADAWAYLKVRGILNDEISYSSPLTRDQLLNICMCIADEDSRSDYKTIQVILDIEDVFRNDGYFPVYDFEYSQDGFASSVTYNYEQSTVYHYIIPKQKGYDIGEAGELRVSSGPEWSQKTAIQGAKVLGIQNIDNNDWYVVEVPKSYQGSLYITCYALKEGSDNHTVKGDVSCIEIPSTCLGGGFFTTLTKTETNAVVDANSFAELDTRSADPKVAPYVDYKRAGEEKPATTTTASNASIFEALTCLWESLTTPEVYYATESDLKSGTDIEAKVEFKESALKPEELTLTPAEQEVIMNASGSGIKIKDIAEFSTALKFPDGTSISSVVSVAPKEGTGMREGCILNPLPTGDNYRTVLNLNRIAKLKEFPDAKSTIDKIDEAGSIASIKNLFKAFIDATPTYTSYDFIKACREGEGKLTEYYFMGDAPVPGKSSLHQNYRTFLAQFAAGNYPASYGIHHENVGYSYYLNKGTLSSPETFDRFGSSGGNEANIKKLLESCITDEDDEFLTQMIVTQKAKVSSSNPGGYSITASDPDAVLDLIGKLNSTEEEQEDSSSTGPNENEITADLNRSVASSVIMNRDEQILIRWKDLVDAKAVVDTFNGGQPKPTADGSYYFYTPYGQVKVNENQHTIQIGTTIYDLYVDGEKPPRLVYPDNETGELYFDYRCVMGVVTSRVTRNDKITEEVKNTLGSGDYAIYDIGSNQGSNFELKNFNCYNYPEIPSTDGTHKYNDNIKPYQVPLVHWTQYDDDAKEGETPKLGYWMDAEGNAPTFTRRLQLNAFVPTANWLYVIDSNSGGTSGSLYVYYLREPFENGFAGSDGNITQVKVPDIYSEANKASTVNEIVTKTQNITKVDYKSKKTISQIICEIYGISNFNIDTVGNLPWYDIMSIDAIANLYNTTGKYMTSSDFVIREFKLENNAAMLCTNYASDAIGTSIDQKHWIGDDLATGIGNLPGMCYWIDTIGMIYNLPSTDLWTLEGYLNGEFLLPLAYDSTGTNIINYNMNSYGNAKDVNGTIANKVPYGYVLNDKGYKHYASDSYLKDEDGNDITLPSKKPNGSYHYEGQQGADSKYRYPFEFSELKTAPVGVYYYFGGNPEETLKVSAMTSYVVDTNKIFYGTHQLKMYASATNSSSAMFFLGSDNWAPISVDSNNFSIRVHRTSTQDTFILSSSAIKSGATTDISSVEVDDYPGSGLDNLLDKLGANNLIELIDSGSSILILIAFNILPIIGIILMTILVGLSFIADNKVFQAIAEKSIDPVRFLTFGARDMYRWHWKTVLFPCILLYISFALFLNGNLIRLIQWFSKWYDIVLQWVTSL